MLLVLASLGLHTDFTVRADNSLAATLS